MGEFLVSPRAVSDLEKVYEAGVERFGSEQAGRYQEQLFGCFQLLADFPGIAGPAFKVRSRDVFRFPYGSHVVVFTKTDTGIRVARVFHESMDWRALLARRGL